MPGLNRPASKRNKPEMSSKMGMASKAQGSRKSSMSNIHVDGRAMAKKQQHTGKYNSPRITGNVWGTGKVGG